MTDARLARISDRVLTRGTPAARVAQVGARALTRLGVTDAKAAQLGMRALVTLVAAGATVKTWNGSAFVSAPVKVWNGTAFVDALAVKTWNGTVFV